MKKLIFVIIIRVFGVNIVKANNQYYKNNNDVAYGGFKSSSVKMTS